MIRAEDLRIGNLLENFLGEKIAVNTDTLKMFESGNFRGFPQPKPITLTEDILLKCGFVKDEFDNWENETRLGLYKPDEFDGYLSIWGDSTVGECNYLHQLQNLYFALTNEELNILLNDEK